MGSGVSMDYIEEKIENLKQMLKNSSLRRTLGIYIILAVFGVILCFAATVMFCESWRNLILSKYQVVEGFHITDNIGYISSTTEISGEDRKLLLLFDIAQPIALLLYSVLAILITTGMFYRNKLREPIKILREEAACIGRNDLSYECKYESGDEMGEICYAFDEMRKQLIKNQKTVWNLMEDQRSLNAAFAHDLRTPITVMQGYTELLMKYYPIGKISEEKLMSTISLLQEQLVRLKRFSETMSEIHTFDSLEVKKKKGNTDTLVQALQKTAKGLMQIHPLEINIIDKVMEKECYFDEHAILEVAENLLSNAIRYGKTTIDVLLERENELLHLYVRDDGRGFTPEGLYQAQRPYYTEKSGDLEHFGIGLTICKLLCEKHGGSISFSNSMKGGAIICADFFVL